MLIQEEALWLAYFKSIFWLSDHAQIVHEYEAPGKTKEYYWKKNIHCFLGASNSELFCAWSLAQPEFQVSYFDDLHIKRQIIRSPGGAIYQPKKVRFMESIIVKKMPLPDATILERAIRRETTR